MKILLILISCLCFVCNHAIQVFENIQNDTTTLGSLAISPLPTSSIVTAINELSTTSSTTASTKSPITVSTEHVENKSTTPLSVSTEKNLEVTTSTSNDNNLNSNKTEKNKTASTQIDQQQKSTAQQIKHEKFVPSPELDDPPLHQQPIHYKHNTFKQSGDSFYPTNQYYKPLVYGLYHGTSTHLPEIVNTPPSSSQQWKHGKELLKSVPNNHKYHQQLNEPQNQLLQTQSFNEREKHNKLLWNPSENGQWVWMPNQAEQTIDKVPLTPPTTTTTIPEKWSWNFNEIFNKPLTSQTPISYDTPAVKTYHHHHTISPVITTKDHPYSFDSFPPTISSSTSETASSSSSTLPSVFIYETSSDEEERYKHENRYQHQLDMYNQQGSSTTSVPIDWTHYLNNGRDHEMMPRRPNVSPWKKIIHVLSAAIPLGLLISALTPQVIYVNPNSTNLPTIQPPPAAMASKYHRILDDNNKYNNNDEIGRKMTNPLMDFLAILNENQQNGLEKSAGCDDRSFCEISRLGREKNADVLPKMLWKIALETTSEQAKKTGLYEIFQAVKENNCSIFKCEHLTINHHHKTNKNHYYPNNNNNNDSHHQRRRNILNI